MTIRRPRRDSSPRGYLRKPVVDAGERVNRNFQKQRAGRKAPPGDEPEAISVPLENRALLSFSFLLLESPYRTSPPKKERRVEFPAGYTFPVQMRAGNTHRSSAGAR